MARRISDRVDALEQQPRPSGCLKLTGEPDLWRLRIGDYRVVYRIDDDQQMVKILRIRHRRDAYD
jgi:mRNA interferase RelE/StbE